MNIGTKLRHSKVASFALVAALGVTALPTSTVAATPNNQAKAPAKAPAKLPASMPFADSAFESVWTRNDQPVAAKAAARGWTWGPAPMQSGVEAYEEAPDGSKTRLVQ